MVIISGFSNLTASVYGCVLKGGETLSELILYERKENAAWITLNNPTKLNCLSRSMVRELNSYLTKIKMDTEISAVIITGAGSTSFCAGMNVNEFDGLTPKGAHSLISELKELCLLARTIPQVVIVSINGYCIGAALELAMAADLRIASKNAVFAMPEIKLGIPSVLDSVLLQQYVGLSLAREMLLTGDSVDLVQINQYGFINKVVEFADLKAETEILANRVTVNDSLTVATQKRLFETWQNSSLNIAVQDSVNEFSLSFTTDVPQKRLDDYLSSKKVKNT